MRWTPGDESSNVEDERGNSGGGGGGFQFGAPHLGIGGILILIVLSVVFKRDFLSMVGQGGVTSAPAYSSQTAGTPASSDPNEQREVQFVSFVLDDVQNTWRQTLGPQYRDTKLVLFRDHYPSACGTADEASGPFYCPGDHKVYLDLGFYEELKRRFGAPGEFAQAYVLAHEIGHHVQSLMGIEQKVRQMQEANPSQANALSVRLELQADCFAGVWGHSTQQRNILESGDVEAGLNAAAAVGDDRLQKSAGHSVNQETFTHGSSAQRVQWFQKGFTEGTVQACNTFQ